MKAFIILSTVLLMNNSYCSHPYKYLKWEKFIYNNTQFQIATKFNETKNQLHKIYDEEIKKINNFFDYNTDLFHRNFKNTTKILNLFNGMHNIKIQTFTDFNHTIHKINHMVHEFKKDINHILEDSKNNIYLNSSSVKNELDYVFNKVKNSTTEIIIKEKKFMYQYNITEVKNIIENTEYTFYPILLYYEEGKVNLYEDVSEAVMQIIYKLPKQKIKRMSEFLYLWDKNCDPELM